jgi:hypothetical protein
MKKIGISPGTLIVFLLFLPFSNVAARTTLSLGTGVLSSSSGLKNGFGYELGIEKTLWESRYLEIYSGIRATYIPVQLKSHFATNAPHDLFYLGIPAGMLALIKGNMLEPFIGCETQLDYKAFDHKENKPDIFCDINGDCTDSGPSIQPERYEHFILRASPKIGSIIDLGKLKILITSGIRVDLTTFARRGQGETRTSSLLVGTGLVF